MPFFCCFVKRFFVEYISMENIKALLIDCDGVLYDKSGCTGDDIVQVGLKKTLEQYHISWDDFEQVRTDLKTTEIRGLFNAIFDICTKRHIELDTFTNAIVANTDYSRISKDSEMLSLLQQAANIVPTCIVTNNTLPHLIKIFDRLRGKTSPKNLSEELNLHIIAIENTLAFDIDHQRAIFHPKQMKNQFKKICAQLDLPPEQVALIDDTERIRKKASEQGLVTIEINGPADTKAFLTQFLTEKTNEKQRTKRHFPVRKARSRTGN